MGESTWIKTQKIVDGYIKLKSMYLKTAEDLKQTTDQLKFALKWEEKLRDENLKLEK